MNIQRVKPKKIRRSDLENYEALEACELRDLMIENNGSEIATTLNNLDPAIKLLYSVYQWRLDHNEGVVQGDG